MFTLSKEEKYSHIWNYQEAESKQPIQGGFPEAAAGVGVHSGYSSAVKAVQAPPHIFLGLVPSQARRSLRAGTAGK